MPCKYCLVIDDNQIPLKILKKVLEKAGWCVICCQSPEIVPALLMDNMVDLVITDYWMGTATHDGVKILRDLRQYVNERTIPVICVSAHAGSRERFLEAGGTAWYPKPFREQDIMDILRKYT